MTFKEIEQKIRSVENQEIIYKYRAFQSSIELLDRNYHMILRLLNEAEKPKSKFELIPRYNKWLLEGIVKEIGFLLHNYVASSLSLIDHSRRIYEETFERKDTLSKYEEMKTKFLKSPYLKFVQDLRRMMQHHSLVSIGFQYLGGSGEKSFYLQKVDLLRFKDWTSKSKTLIENFGDKIKVKDIVENYHKVITNFHKEVNTQFKIIYSAELNELDDLYKLYNEKVNELGINELREHVENFDDQKFHGIKFSLSKWLNSSEQAELFKKAKSDKEYCKLALPVVKKKVSIPNDIVKLITKLINER